MKNKYFAFLLIIVSMTFLGLAGCGDIYRDLRVEVSTNLVELYLDDFDTEGDESEFSNTQIITATVLGASDEMVKDVYCKFDDDTVATGEVLSIDDNKSTIRITAKNAGRTNLRIVSNELSSVMSEAIDVVVYKMADSMDSLGAKTSVLVGSNLTLETNSLVAFSPSRVYPSTATFTLMSPESDLWDYRYGSNALSGVSIVNNVLIAAADADCGIAQVEAAMPNGIKCAVLVMVYRGISGEQIQLFDNNAEGDALDSIKLTINSDQMNTADLHITVEDEGQNLIIRTQTSEDIAGSTDYIVEPSEVDDFGNFSLNAREGGTTTLIINVDIVDNVTGTVYKTFTKSYAVEVVRMATHVMLSSQGGVAKPTQLELLLQDYYESINVRGADVNVVVAPDSAKDRNFEIRVVEIDGFTEDDDEFAEKLENLAIYVNSRNYVTPQETYSYNNYIFGELLRNDTTFYVALTGENIKTSVTLAMVANIYDTSLPQNIQNTVHFTVTAGVTEIKIENEKFELGLDENKSFSFDFVTSAGENVGTPSFTVEIANTSVATIQKEADRTYTLTALKEGSTSLTITAESGVSVTIPVYVYCEIDTFYIQTDHSYQNSNIALDSWNASGFVNDDGLFDSGITSMTVKQGSLIDVACIFSPTSENEGNVTIAIDADDNGRHIRLSSLSRDNTFYFRAVNATSEPVNLIVRFEYNKQNADGSWTKERSERVLEISVYKPLLNFYWSGTNNLKQITTQLYDKNSLNIDDQGLASTTLTVFADSTATVLQNGGSIVWNVADTSLLTLTPNGTSASITAALSPEDALTRYETYVYATVTEYNRQLTISCRVIIVRPTLISSIEITNFDSRDGAVHLNDLGSSERTSFTIYTSISPKSPFNSRLGYKLYNATTTAGGLPIATTEYTGAEEDAVVVFDSAMPNRIIAKNAGICVIRIYPLDRITSEDISISDIYYVDLPVIVEDGVLNPYTIYTAEEFLAIGSSPEALTKNYDLMQTIDLSNYSAYLPLGDFGGTLNSSKFAQNGIKKSIIGIKLNSVFLSNESEMLTGLFSGISGSVRNIDFSFSGVNLDLSSAVVSGVTDVYVGLLAGKIAGNIENVAVKLSNFEDRTVNISGIDNANITLYVGALAGQMSGLAQNVYTNVSFTVNAGTTNLVLGGLVGKYSGLGLGQQTELLNKVIIKANRDGVISGNNDAIGGLVGENSGTIYGYKASGSLTAQNFDNVGGFVGKNSGTLGQFINNKEYRAVSSVKVRAHDYVGGLAGFNSGQIDFGRAENYEEEGLNGASQAQVYARNYVGGLVGYSQGGAITYSYAMGFVSLEFSALGNGTYNGDVIGSDYVGGLVGYFDNSSIQNSFARNKIQVTGASGIGGGLVGKIEIAAGASIATYCILNSFVNVYILALHNDDTKLGELAGIYETGSNNNYIDTCYAHAIVSLNGTYSYKMFGLVTNGGVQDTYYLITDEVISTTSGAATHDEMLAFGNNIYSGSGWGFGTATGIPQQTWVLYDADTMQDVNDNLPILFGKDRNWLYNQSISSIQISANTLHESGKILPTYFTDTGLGSVIVLDNIESIDGGKRVKLLNSAQAGLLNVSVTPPQLDVADWNVEVVSSNRQIIEVVQETQSLDTVYLEIKGTGVVKLTIRSLLDTRIYAEIEINIISGFSAFDILDDNDNSIFAQEISIKKDYGKRLFPHFTRSDNAATYYDTIGVKYFTTDTSYFEFNEYAFSGGLAYIPYSKPHLLGGIKSTESNLIEIVATPYVELNFGGESVCYSLEKFAGLEKNFYVKVYEGITGGVLSASSATITSSGNITLSLDVYSDNTSAVIIAEPVVTSGGVVVENSVVLTNLGREVVLDESINQKYLLQIAEGERGITENLNYRININVSDESGLYKTFTFDITITPTPISYITLSHYTYGASSMDSGEVASNLIAPGTRGVLKVNISPYYSLFDYVLLSSSTDTVSNQQIALQQLVYSNGRYIALETNLDASGALIASKITGYDALGQPYFDGNIFVRTLLGSYVTEGTPFTISLSAMKSTPSGDVLAFSYPSRIELVTTFAPNATLSLVRNEGYGDTVARGTEAILHLDGVLQNSTISLSASYGLGAEYSSLERCAFDEIQTRFGFGARENVSLDIPFYVGILARPANGTITITLTINSTTATGGQLNPIVLEYILYIVDYHISSVYTQGASDGVLNVNIRTYRTLQTVWELVTPSLETYRKYNSNIDESGFNAAVSAIEEKVSEKTREVNERGNGQGGVWRFNDGSGFVTVQSAYSYENFILSYTTMNSGLSYYIIKGKNTVSLDFDFNFYGYYVFDSALGCYVLTLDDELSSASGSVLQGYERLFNQSFVVTIINDTTDDTPDLIDSVEKFRSMTAGVSYMLTTDIVLENWTPIDTAITSLDGNGYIIYLRSFADTGNATNVNYGLFSTVPENTVLKNLIVDVSYNIFVDLQGASTVNFGFIAGVNNGMIYNCEVVVTQNKDDWRVIYDNSTRQYSQNSDFNFANSVFNQLLDKSDDSKYANFNTLASAFIMTDLSTANNAVTTNIGALVGQNAATGTITNSRVGRVDKQNYLGVNKVYALQGLNLFASGDVGGLVGENDGAIANSYFANGMVVNYSSAIYSTANPSGARTGGLVAEQTNTGSINSSYALGQLDNDAQCSLGGIVAYGTIGGLVHSNSGVILNSYANLPLSSSNAIGGFVYQNLGAATIKYSYSMSKINSTGLINGIFIGVNAEGDVLNSANAVVENCYYYSTDNSLVDTSNPATAISAEEWANAKGLAFDGFVIAEDNDSTWYIDSTRTYLGPQLRFADRINYSHRSNDYTYDIDCEYGSERNPIIISNLTDWENVFNYQDESGEIRSSFMDRNPAYSSNSSSVARYIFGDFYVTLINNVDFGTSMHATSYSTIFTGKLMGNGYNLSGLNYRYSNTSSTSVNDFGLFSGLNGARVYNLNLVVDNQITTRARHMGALAGTIKDSFVENITITGSNSQAAITGLNMTGALAGFVGGDSEIYNIESRISVSSISATVALAPYRYYYTEYSDSSYAGGIIGVLDMNYEENAENSPRVQGLLVTGNATIYGEIAGGVVGLVATDAEIKNARFMINTATGFTPKILGTNFSGGLVGENRGQIISSFIGLSVQEQKALDSTITSSTNALNHIGYAELFENTNATTAVGGLVGLNTGGIISYSYSRVAVVASKASISGGLIGMAISAPENYSPNGGDSTLNYLRNLSQGESSITAISGLKSYTENNGNIVADGGFDFSATLYQVYTTSAVNSNKVIGGLVGAVIGAPLYASASNAYIVGLNNFDSNTAFTSKVNDENYNVGSVVGYLGYVVSGNSTVAVVGSRAYDEVAGKTTGTAATNIRAVGRVGSVDINPVGKIATRNDGDTPPSLNLTMTATSFINYAVSASDKAFESFSSTIWELDNSKIAHRFPILKSNYSASVVEIDTVDKFFEFLSNTNENSYGKITADLTISGSVWQGYVLDYNNRTLSDSLLNAISGRLEGAVPSDFDSALTRNAKITFTNFSTVQAARFDSLFGYTSKFRLLNIDFVFDFDIDATSHSLSSFGLLAQESVSSNFENMSLSIINENKLTVNKLDNIGMIVGKAQSCSFTNVVVSGSVVTPANFAANVANTANFGALIGLATIDNTISGSDYGEWTLNYTSIGNYQMSIGGLVGRSSGILNLRGVNMDNENLKFNAEITANSNLSEINVGGVVGKLESSAKIQNFMVAGEITINRQNGNTNSNAYIGGIVGNAVNTNFAYLDSRINLNSFINNGNVYLGGISGYIENRQRFTGTSAPMQFSGYTAQYVSVNSCITHSADSNNQLYLGSVFGEIKNNLVMANQRVVPVGEARNIVESASSYAKLTVNSTANQISVGGLIGSARQGLLNSDSYTELERPNAVLRIAESAFLGEILAQNLQAGSSDNFLGGIVGYSQLAIYDALSNGVVSFDAENAISARIGGIAGYTNNDIGYCIVTSSVQGRYPTTGLVSTTVNAISGAKESTSRVIYSYYSAELVGVLDNSGINLSALEMLDASSFTNRNTMLLTNWTYATKQTEEGAVKQISFMYPTLLTDYLDLSSESEMVPCFVDSIEMLNSQLTNAEKPNKTIIFDVEKIYLAGIPNIALTNARKIIGNGVQIEIADLTGTVAGNAGLFSEIPRNVVVSGITVSYGKTQITASGELNFGGLAGVNNGSVYGCSVYGEILPESRSALASDFTNIDSKFSNNFAGLTQNELPQIYLNAGSNQVVMGGVVGVNNGQISVVFNNIDIYANSGNITIGGLVGLSDNSTISNCLSQGRIIVNNMEASAFVGGIAGRVNNSFVSASISNGNIMAFSTVTQNLGLAFGEFSGVMAGVIVNSNLSGNLSLDETNANYNSALTTTQMQSASTMNTVLKNSSNLFNTSVWSVGESAKNYGYPYLSALNNTNLNTGDGTVNNPFYIREGTELLRVTQSASGKHFVIIRDLALSAENFETTSNSIVSARLLDGRGNVVLVEELAAPRTSSGILNVGVFKTISESTTVTGLAIVLNQSNITSLDTQINFGALASENRGNITHCAAVALGTINLASLPNSRIGGLVGLNNGSISYSWADVDISAKDGYIGGLVGLLGLSQSASATSTASIRNSFAQSSLLVNQNTSLNYAITSVGGLVGLANAEIDNGYTIENCYVYGAKIFVSHAGSNVGALIGNALKFDITKTYAYVYTAGALDSNVGAGNYTNLSQVGNEIIGAYDSTSVIAVWLGMNDGSRETATERDTSLVTVITSLRSTSIGVGCYLDWRMSVWTRNASVGGSNEYTPYLINVTPFDRQESSSSDLSAQAIFDL